MPFFAAAALHGLILKLPIAPDGWGVGELTAIAVYGAATLAGHWGPWGLALGLAIAFFEAITVLVLRAHYTMDVFTGIVCALWVYTLSGQFAPHVDSLIQRLVG